MILPARSVIALCSALLLLLLAVPAQRAAAAPSSGSCYPQLSEPALVANGPADWSQTWNDRFVVTGGDLFLIPLRVASAMLASSVRIFPGGERNSGALTVRAALYDWQSALLVQTEQATLTGGPALVQAELRLASDIVLTPGQYGVGLWFAPRSSAGAEWGVNVTVTGPSVMYSRTVLAAESFDSTNGSFPLLLAPWVKWGWLTMALAARVQVVGLACANQLPAAPISLNSSVSELLERLRIKAGGRPPGMGAALLQLPSSLDNLTASTVPADAVCPFVLVALAVSGVRRADAVRPEPVQLTDRWQLSNYSFALTAVLIHQAVEQGLLRLNSTVADVLPYLPLSADSSGGMGGDCGCGSSQGYFAQSQYACGARIHPSWQNVTVAHMLTQVSGLVSRDGTMTAELAKLRSLEARGEAETCTDYAVPSRRYLLSKLLALAPLSPPLSPDVPTASNGGMGASAINGLVLGFMLEELHGREWERLASSVFQRLGMDSAGIGQLSAAVPLNQSAGDVYGHSFGTQAALSSTAQDVPAAWAASSSLHASIADWARLVACQLQEGRDLSAAGLPPPTDGPAPPYLLRAETWQAVHRRKFYPEDWKWEPQSFSLSGLQSWNGSAIPIHLDEQARTAWWSSASRIVTQAAPPFAILLTANWGHIAGYRPGFDELDDRAREAVQALHTLYDAWWQQQRDSAARRPGDGISEDQSALIALSLAVCGILLITAAIVTKVRWDERRSSTAAPDNDEPLLHAATET